jgi:hypothetical protein
MVENASCSAAEQWLKSEDRRNLSEGSANRGAVYVKFMQDFYRAVDDGVAAGKPPTSGAGLDLIQNAYNIAVQSNSRQLTEIGASAALVLSSSPMTETELVSYKNERSTASGYTDEERLASRRPLSSKTNLSAEPAVGEMLGGANGDSQFSLSVRFETPQHQYVYEELIPSAPSNVKVGDPIDKIATASTGADVDMKPITYYLNGCPTTP